MDKEFFKVLFSITDLFDLKYTLQQSVLSFH